MTGGRLWRAFFLAGLWCALGNARAAGQAFVVPSPTNRMGAAMGLTSIESVGVDSSIFQINTRNLGNSPLESPSGSVSKLDLKSPAKARQEYEKGYQLLMKKDLQGAIEHLARSVGIYPSFVAAHNALGTAYLNLGQNGKAHEEFSTAIKLDDHLPNSYLNLGCAQLALEQYSDAEESLRKASSIAPLDLQLLTALAYGEFRNRDYPAVIATARQVHQGKHAGAAVVHFLAAEAWEAQGNLTEAQHEMETLLREEPKSPSAGQFRQILEEIKTEEARREEAKKHPIQRTDYSISILRAPGAEELSRRAQQILQDLREKRQIAEAEAEPDATCIDCRKTAPVPSSGEGSSIPGPEQPDRKGSGTVFRLAVDEVAIFFSATDHGISVTNLTAADIEIRDDNQPPAGILVFRNEDQLPLRLGLVIDTSNSVKDRFSFEQAAASKFLETVIKDRDDLAFVLSVNNSVLVVQDFTGDQSLASRAVGELAPGGGTALWDAVAFAANKLAERPENQPVARILVVISDGEDNSSSVTLKQAVEDSQRGEVAVYTVNTRDNRHEEQSALIGDHALKTLSELTGGTAFMPGSVNRLNGSLADLQQVIRGRYLVSYKPSSFQHDGRYRAITIKAAKDGHPLKVYARKGYYASGAQADSSEH